MAEDKFVKKKLTFAYSSVLATVALLSCLDNIQVLNSALHIFHYFYLIRYILIVLLLFSYIWKRKKIGTITSLICAFFGLMIVMTFIKGGDLFSSIQILSRPILISLVIDYYRNRIQRVLAPWMYICLALLLIDISSMILFPKGLYTTALYSINWFLGYKTARYEYILPLCLISLFFSYKRKEKIEISTLIILFLSLFDLWFSQATAAFLSLAFVVVVILLDNIKDLFKQKTNILYTIFSRMFVITFYTLANIALFSIERLPIVQDFVVNVLHKDPTLTTRTTLWARVFVYISKSPFWGNGYLSFDQFVFITENQYAGSAHNLMIRILINVGVIGLALFYIIVLMSLPGKNDKKLVNKQYFVLCMGLIAGLVVGLTSDALFLTFFNFALIQLLYFSKHNQMRVVKRSGE